MTREQTESTPVYDDVVREHGDPEPDMRYRPQTYREIRERGDRRPVLPPQD